MAQIETAQNAYQAHEYLGEIKGGGNTAFQSAFEGYLSRYALKGGAKGAK